MLLKIGCLYQWDRVKAADEWRSCALSSAIAAVTVFTQRTVVKCPSEYNWKLVERAVEISSDLSKYNKLDTEKSAPKCMSKHEVSG